MTQTGWQWKDFVWYNAITLLVWHIMALYSLFFVIPTASGSQIMLGVLFWYLSGLGITAGSHRLWAHRSYKAKLPLKVFLMLCNSMALQGPIFEWSRDHRTHHKASETEADPHNAKRGFWFAHIGWVVLRKNPKVFEKGKTINCDDMKEDGVVMWQNRNYRLTIISMCYVVPALCGHYLGSAWQGFWIAGVFRHVWVLHMTWFVNSAAHLWGDRPYDTRINPAENFWVAVGAIGEGWHNFHHKYPNDYAAGEYGIFSGQWNPTKLFIDLMALCGLAWDLKKSTTASKARILNAEKAQERMDETTGFMGNMMSKLFSLMGGMDLGDDDCVMAPPAKEVSMDAKAVKEFPDQATVDAAAGAEKVKAN